MDKDKLRKLIEEDESGILNLRPKASPLQSQNERLIASFREINQFYKEHQREPIANKADVREMMLFSRLITLRSDEAKISVLADYDEFSLLGEPKKIESFDDIFSDDSLDILSSAEDSIFTLKHVPQAAKVQPDFVARREPCEDFDRFESLFKECQKDLSQGRRNLGGFTQENQIKPGQFFVLKGILCYVAEEGAPEKTSDDRFNTRLRCVFENETESRMLLRSLAAALYKDGRRVSSDADAVVAEMQTLITPDDKDTGHIYILQSLSKDEKIRSIKNLYKIGFTKGSVDDRIKNAAEDPTYLMAPVKIVSAFRCLNVDTHKFESLLHQFFGKACLDVSITDLSKKKYTPKEWFVAPLPVIEQAVRLLENGEIIYYRFDSETGEIELR